MLRLGALHAALADAERRRANLCKRHGQQRERMLPQTEIVLWTTPEGPPKASRTSECRWAARPYESRLLDRGPAPAR